MRFYWISPLPPLPLVPRRERETDAPRNPWFPPSVFRPSSRKPLHPSPLSRIPESGFIPILHSTFCLLPSFSVHMRPPSSHRQRAAPNPRYAIWRKKMKKVGIAADSPDRLTYVPTGHGKLARGNAPGNPSQSSPESRKGRRNWSQDKRSAAVANAPPAAARQHRTLQPSARSTRSGRAQHLPLGETLAARSAGIRAVQTPQPEFRRI